MPVFTVVDTTDGVRFHGSANSVRVLHGWASRAKTRVPGSLYARLAAGHQMAWHWHDCGEEPEEELISSLMLPGDRRHNSNLTDLARRVAKMIEDPDLKRLLVFWDAGSARNPIPKLRVRANGLDGRRYTYLASTGVPLTDFGDHETAERVVWEVVEARAASRPEVILENHLAATRHSLVVPRSERDYTEATEVVVHEFPERVALTFAGGPHVTGKTFKGEGAREHALEFVAEHCPDASVRFGGERPREEPWSEEMSH